VHASPRKEVGRRPQAKASPVVPKAKSPSTTPSSSKDGQNDTKDSTEKNQAESSKKKPRAESANKGSKNPSPPHGAAESPKKRKNRAESPQRSPNKSQKIEQGESKESKQDPEAAEKKKKAHKLYMRFWRSVHESRETPMEIKNAFDRFKYCKTQMSALYEDFVQCAGKWVNSVVLKTIRHKRKNGRRAARKWMTKSQLLSHFGDESVVEAIVLRKEADKDLAEAEIRDHPDLPGLKQYLVLVEDEELDESTDEIEQLFKMEQNPGSESSDDDSKDSDEESSSSGAAKKKKNKSKDKKAKKDKKEQKDKSKKNKRKRGNKGKNLRKAETQEDLDKEQSRKVQQEGKKVISTLNRKIKDATTKIDSKEVGALNEVVRDALKKDLQAVVKKLTSARTQLQTALDSAQDSKITDKTTAAKDVLDHAEGSLTVGIKKKTEKKGGD